MRPVTSAVKKAVNATSEQQSRQRYVARTVMKHWPPPSAYSLAEDPTRCDVLDECRMLQMMTVL